jgi:hypothetical protein
VSAAGVVGCVVTAGAASLALLAVVASRAWTVSWALPCYLSVVVLTNLTILVDLQGWSWTVYFGKEAAIAALKLVMIGELAGTLFSDRLRGASERARRLIAAGLILLLALLVASAVTVPAMRTFRALAIVNAGCALLLAGLWLISLFHVVPLHPVGRALLHGLSAYSISVTALMGLAATWPGLTALTGRASEVIYTGAMLYLARAAVRSTTWRPLEIR